MSSGGWIIRDVLEMEEFVTYQAIIEKGIEKGIAQGKEEGKRDRVHASKVTRIITRRLIGSRSAA